MISYDSGNWAIGFAFQRRGSVVPKALRWAVPIGAAAALTFWIHRTYFENGDFSSLDTITNSYSVVLGFLLVYRAQTASTRFWDGATHLYTTKAVWFNAASAIFSFCSAAPAKAAAVQQFQHQLVRLLSLLYASALQTVAGPSDWVSFAVLNTDGLEAPKIEWVECQHDKLEVIMQWVQHLIVDMHRKAIVDVPPPILSRVFQEFSNGMIDVANAKRIVKFPFPFPYAQMISLMLFAHGAVTILVAGLSMSTWYFAFFYAFFSSGTLWAINYIAIEIEMPFGQDPNDLPLESMQKSMNDCLIVLLHPLTQQPPCMEEITGQHLNINLKPWTIGRDLRVETYSARGSVQYEIRNRSSQFSFDTDDKSADEPAAKLVEQPVDQPVKEPCKGNQPVKEPGNDNQPVTGPCKEPVKEIVKELVKDSAIVIELPPEPKPVKPTGKTAKQIVTGVAMESQLEELVKNLRTCSEAIALELRQWTHMLAEEHQHRFSRESTARSCRIESEHPGFVNPVTATLQSRASVSQKFDDSKHTVPMCLMPTEL